MENLKIALEGLQADRTESRAMMQYARELQEIWDNALMDAARNNRGAVEAESRQQASPRKKYWRPDLAENEWRLLERRMGEEIGSREDFLDEATKWVYANEKRRTSVRTIWHRRRNGRHAAVCGGRGKGRRCG